jgi:hypothetical protein
LYFFSFVLSFFYFFSFFFPFSLFLLFALQLPCMSMCGCNGSISSFLLLGAHSTASTRKTTIYVCIFTNKREKENPVDSITTVLLYLYNINYYAEDAAFFRKEKENAWINIWIIYENLFSQQKIFAIIFIILFILYIMAKKGYYHQLNKHYVLTLHQYKGQPWSVTPYHWFIYWSKVNHITYIHMHIRLTHLDYIGLYYRILNEILDCDYIRSFVDFFSPFFI